MKLAHGAVAGALALAITTQLSMAQEGRYVDSAMIAKSSRPSTSVASRSQAMA